MAARGNVVRINSGDNDSLIGSIIGGDGNPWWVIELHDDGRVVEEKDSNLTVFDGVEDQED